MPAWREIVQYLEHRHALYFIAAAIAALWWLVSLLRNWVRRWRQQERRERWTPLDGDAVPETPAPRKKPRRRIPLQ